MSHIDEVNVPDMLNLPVGKIKAARSKYSVTSPFSKTEKITFHKCENFLCVCSSGNLYGLPHNIYSLLTTVKLVKTLN